ncbi:MAG: uroporphyrinogen decarboxylase family protein, partial [Planctomycetota bacterium]|nr:uroporphyrinogen decarboxylase family protein [Planctomycetota bacterium]
GSGGGLGSELPSNQRALQWRMPYVRLLDAAGGDVIGIDYRIDLDAARKILDGKPMQGNLDPCALLAERKPLLAEAGKVLEQAGGQPGHIFNLGHGILKETPVDNVIALVDYVHEESNA